MLRVLMVLEDYGELMFLQTVLKKIGFDVDAIQNPRVFSDSLLTMNPDVLVMTAAGKRVKGVELKKSVRRVRGLPHIILLGTYELPDPDVEAWLPSPVPALQLLSAIGDICGLDKDVLKDKFEKLRFKEGELPGNERDMTPLESNEPGPVMEKSDGSEGSFGRLQPSVMSSSEREDRYKKFLSGALPKEKQFALKDVQTQVKALRAAAADEKQEDLERERRAFVEHLFKKDEN